MKLYLLSQTENNDYDTFDSCVVCAESEEDAKSIMPNHGKGQPFNSEEYNGWASSIENVRCVEIGTANEDQERGVIVASFNAG